jgi:hypothetical protein
MNDAKSLHDLLSMPNQSSVLERGQVLIALQRKLDGLLPESFRGQVFVSSLNNGTLSLACAHNALASRLRSEGPRIVQALARQGLKVSQTRIFIRPDLPLYRGPAKPKTPFSKKALKVLEQAEKELEEGELKSALEQMIRHHKD